MSVYRNACGLVSLGAGKVLKRGTLPCSVISRDPPIIAAFGWDFINGLPEILGALPSRQKSYVLWKLGYECETPERLKQEAEFYHRLDDTGKNIECTYLCNSPKEVKNLEGRGIRAVLCNHNSFIDERKFPLLPHCTKTFDAVYQAMVTPCKRHHLAGQIERLLVIGGCQHYEKEYALKEMGTIPHARWIKKVLGFNVHKHFASAHVGLCLSDREGAMYASAEYLLCGLPVVNTPNIGGRDEFFGPEYTRTVEPTEEAVAQAVYELMERKIDPYYIREAALKKMQVHRDNYLNLLESIFKKEGKNFDRERAWKKFFFHKLGVRTVVSPWVSWHNLLRPNTFR